MTQTQPVETQPVGNQFRTETRTFAWTPPGQADLSRLLALDGLEQLLAMRAGEMPPPPIMDTLGVTDLRPEPGRVVVEMAAAEFHYNPLGTVHGGVLCDIADGAMGMAFASTLGAGESFTTLELKINYLKPVWRAVLEPSAAAALTAPERAVLDALEHTTLSPDLRRVVRRSDEPGQPVSSFSLRWLG